MRLRISPQLLNGLLAGRLTKADALKAIVPERTPLWHIANGTFTRSDQRKWLEQWTLRTNHLVAFKPQRRLGASWMDDAISQGKSVALCEDCCRKYGAWWRPRHYLPELTTSITDCDGCSQHLQDCTLFFPATLKTERPRNPLIRSL